MINSPHKTSAELVGIAREATSDYITNGTPLTEAVVKAASAAQPLTSEHVRRICEMTYHDAYERLFAEKTGAHQYVSFDPPDAIKAAAMLDAKQISGEPMDKTASAPAVARMVKYDPKIKVNHAMQAAKTPKQKRDVLRNLRSMKKEANMEKAKDLMMKRGLSALEALREVYPNMSEKQIEEMAASMGDEEKSPEVVKSASMPKEFKPLNYFDLHIRKEASQSNWHNPTRELEETHRALRDSIKTVRADLYSAEQAEKMAMVEMVKQANAGLSAGFSMEQILHAGLSVVDVSSSFMAKEAHDLCAHIIQACSKHQNAGLTKEASIGEVNPNHPIPTKFAKLANSRIERKHLEVTLDELSRNLDYFNEQLRTL